MVNLVPSSFFSRRFPIRQLAEWDEEDDFLPSPFSGSSGLTISEDEKNVYVETAVPGLDPEKIEVTFDKGVLWVRGNQEQEEKDEHKKFYRKASSAFSYRVAVPGEIDQTKEPEASCKNGVMKIAFAKMPQVEPKKIKVRKE